MSRTYLFRQLRHPFLSSRLPIVLMNFLLTSGPVHGLTPQKHQVYDFTCSASALHAHHHDVK